jgi:hypothetical protein
VQKLEAGKDLPAQATNIIELQALASTCNQERYIAKALMFSFCSVAL